MCGFVVLSLSELSGHCLFTPRLLSSRLSLSRKARLLECATGSATFCRVGKQSHDRWDEDLEHRDPKSEVEIINYIIYNTKEVLWHLEPAMLDVGRAGFDGVADELAALRISLGQAKISKANQQKPNAE